MNVPPSESESCAATQGGCQPEVARRGVGNGFGMSRLSELRVLLPIAAIAVISFAIGLYAGVNLHDIPITPTAAPPSMSQCTAETVAKLNQDQTQSADILRNAREHCYSLIHSHELLKDFAIRQLNFIQQYRANGVLMWMVVAVTLSGVLLAGLQLMASYELAQANRKSTAGDSEISFTKDRIVLRSSITGLFILVISFAFFLVFVFYVYRFEHAENQSIHIPAQTPILPMGGLGPPAGGK